MVCRSPKISVLIASYNMSETICEAIESCFSCISNCEVVVVDDGSEDATESRLKGKYTNNSNFTYHKFSKNRGKVAAFNYAYKLSYGEIIMFLGADDAMLPGRNELNYASVLSDTPQFWVGNYYITDRYLSPVKHVVVKKTSWPSILEQNFYPGGASAFNKVFAEILFPLDEKLGFEDYYAALLACRLGCDRKVERNFLLYRRHSNNTWSKTPKSDVVRKMALRRIPVLEAFSNTASELGFDVSLVNFAKQYNSFLGRRGQFFRALFLAIRLPLFYSFKARLRLVFGGRLSGVFGSK